MKLAHLGCGPRARRHAEAFEFVQKGKIGAICDFNEERLAAFGNDFGVGEAHRYADAREFWSGRSPTSWTS